jgi:acyl-CoA thioester hydrolase
LLEAQTRFADMDVNGHLNNVAIARFFEEGRVRFNWASREALGGTRLHFMVAHVAIDYVAEGHYPAPVTICYGALGAGNSSFRIGMALFQQGRCIAVSDAVLVHLGGDGKPAPLPAALRERLEAHRLAG